MGLYLPVRAFHRRGIRIGQTLVTPTSTAYVDVEDGTVRRDLQRHSAIGVIQVVGPLSSSNEPHRVVSGCVVSEGSDNTDLNLAVTAGEIRNENGEYISVSAVTNVAVSAADGDDERIDRVVADAGDGTVSVVAGTPGSGEAPDVPAGSVSLALVTVPADDTAITNSQIEDARPRM